MIEMERLAPLGLAVLKRLMLYRRFQHSLTVPSLQRLHQLLLQAVSSLSLSLSLSVCLSVCLSLSLSLSGSPSLSG